jgi:two-component system sensor histidine kinase KdpD
MPSTGESPLLAAVALQIRDPLRALTTAVEVLDDVVLQAEAHELHSMVSSISCQATLLRMLVEDILLAAALRRRGLRLSVHVVDLSELVGRAQATVSPLLQERGLRLESQIRGHLPALNADPRRMEHMLTNLLANAAIRAPTGSRVAVSARRLAQGVRMIVTDRRGEAPGADFDGLNTAVDEALSAVLAQPAGATTALSMAVARTIAEAHGGKMLGERLTPCGARFTVDLPVAQH